MQTIIACRDQRAREHRHTDRPSYAASLTFTKAARGPVFPSDLSQLDVVDLNNGLNVGVIGDVSEDVLGHGAECSLKRFDRIKPQLPDGHEGRLRARYRSENAL